MNKRPKFKKGQRIVLWHVGKDAPITHIIADVHTTKNSGFKYDIRVADKKSVRSNGWMETVLQSAIDTCKERINNPPVAPKYKIGDFISNAGQRNWGVIIGYLNGWWKVRDKEGMVYEMTSEKLDRISRATNQNDTRAVHDNCRSIITNRDLQIGILKDTIHEMQTKQTAVVVDQQKIKDLNDEVANYREELRRATEQLRRLEDYRSELTGKVLRYKKFVDRFFNGDMEVDE